MGLLLDLAGALSSPRRLLLLSGIAFLAVWPWSASASSSTSYDAQIIKRHLLDIGGGRRLNIVCVGKGSPVVVFMQGGEGSILKWRKVERPIASLTRVCFYDRAGFGWSDPPRGPVTALSETNDLHTLLRRAHVPTPVILVGHSIGGFYATVYADRFGSDVAGLVLVDPGFATQINEKTAAQRKLDMDNSRVGEARLLNCAALAKQGRMSLDNERGCIEFPKANTPDELAYYANMVTHPFWYEAEVDQSQNYFFGADGGPSVDQLQEQAVQRSFGDMPLIALTHSIGERETWWDDAAWQAFEENWKAGHERLAARSAIGKAIVVPGAEHYIQLSRPDAVIAAIGEVITDVRKADAK